MLSEVKKLKCSLCETEADKLADGVYGLNPFKASAIGICNLLCNNCFSKMHKYEIHKP